MEPFVALLLREDFNAMSNRQLIASAVDRKIAIQSFFEGSYLNHPIILKIETAYGEKVRYFRAIDFTHPRFINAIEDYVIGGARSIVTLAPARGITTAVNQIFGKGGLELIEDGEMVVSGRRKPKGEKAAEKIADSIQIRAGLGNVIPFPFRGMERG